MFANFLIKKKKNKKTCCLLFSMFELIYYLLLLISILIVSNYFEFLFFEILIFVNKIICWSQLSVGVCALQVVLPGLQVKCLAIS